MDDGPAAGTSPRTRARARRWRAVAVVAVTAGLAAAALGAGGAATAAPRTRLHVTGHRHATPLTVAPGLPVHYAVAKPLCSTPSNPRLARCFAYRRVPVAKGTPGATAYTTPSYQVGPAGGYTPADLASAYGYDPTVNRRTNTVGIIDWYDDPNVVSDLNHFDAYYGLPREEVSTFSKVNQRGTKSPLPKADMDSAGEISLDVEAVRAVCHTCRILLVEAAGPSDSSLAAAENTAVRLGALEVSNSFGEPEHYVSAATASAYKHPGVVITASTGDSGWFGWDVANDNVQPPNEPNFPATDPYVVSVGGTSLVLNDNGDRSQEFVWNEDGTDDNYGLQAGQSQGAGGGGCSSKFASPPWQAHHAGYGLSGCGGDRLAADVAALADPYTGFDVYNSYVPSGTAAWGTIGGTSLSAPLVAAMYAVTANGGGDSAYPASSLYVNANVRSYSLFDVVAGGNGFCGGDTTASCSDAVSSGSNGQYNNPNGPDVLVDCSFPRDGDNVASPPPLDRECNAVSNYDGPSGLGTPRTSALFTLTTAALAISHSAGPRAKHSTSFRLAVTPRVSGTKTLSVIWRFGDGTSVTTKTTSVNHTYAKAGHYTVSVVQADNRYQYAIKSAAVAVGS